MTSMPVRIRAIRQEAVDIRSFVLEGLDGLVLPPFSAGCHVDVHLGPGLVRQYSLCNGPGETGQYTIGIKRQPNSRGGSAAMHERLREGDVLEIGAPRNNFPLVADATHHVLVAGGIGVTPLLSMARHLQAELASFELHYFVRSIDDAAFRDALGEASLRDRVRLHPGIEIDAVPPYLGVILARPRAGSHLYLCGPRPFMDLAARVSAAAGWPVGSVHVEHFTADPVSLEGPQGSFDVRLAKSGGTYRVEDHESIVQALARHGIDVEVSCEQGICGTCVTGLIEGVPDHRDSFLTDAEQNACDRLCLCVSRAKSDMLVLDL